MLYSNLEDGNSEIVYVLLQDKYETGISSLIIGDYVSRCFK
jgi:hypothetical protein